MANPFAASSRSPGRPAMAMAWESAARPTLLSAPDGTAVGESRSAAAPGDKNMGSMWTRVQCVVDRPMCHLPRLCRARPRDSELTCALACLAVRRELTRKVEQLESDNQALQGQVTTAQAETGFVQQRLQESDERCAQRADELKTTREREQQLIVQLRAKEEEVAVHERRIADEEAAKAAAGEEPPPPKPEEVRREMLRAFDAAAASICAEFAARHGVEDEAATGDEPMDVTDDAAGPAVTTSAFVIGEDGLDADAMLEAGVPIGTMAEQYLRAVTERAEGVCDKARLQAVEKWRNELGRRRLLQDQLQELKGSIRVMCRVRPAGEGEGESAVSKTNDSDVVLTMPGVSKDGRKPFTFDQCFGPLSKQEDVFEEVAPTLHSVLDGFNVCIFAYGQTGSGKTFTMEGKRSEKSLVGINPRALRTLFELIKEKQTLAAMAGGASTSGSADDGWKYDVRVSYLEIYNENVRDLLTANAASHGGESAGKGKRPSQSLEIRQGEKNTVQVPGLTTISCGTAGEVEAALLRGAGKRSVTATKCNAESSRSHSIVMVTVTGENTVTGAKTHGKLHLVDLAGSERVKKSQVSGQGMAEACNINKSLSALGDVMAALQEKSKHIPFRNSKLTQLLADSLGGNSKTFMFVNVNPVQGAADETLCSLNFASRVRKVELGKASSKRTEGGASLQELRAAKEVGEKAAAELSAAQTRLHELEREAKLSANAQATLEGELATARKAASDYQETEEVLKQSEVERQRIELGEERRRAQALEAKLQEANARSAHAEKSAAAAQHAAAEAEKRAAAAAVSRPPAASPARPAAVAACNSALEQSAERHISTLRSGGAKPVAAGGAVSTAPAAPLVFSSSMTPQPAAPAAFGGFAPEPFSGFAAEPLASPALIPPTPVAAPASAAESLLIPPTPTAPTASASRPASAAPKPPPPPGPPPAPPPAVDLVPVHIMPSSSTSARRPSLLNAAGSLLTSAASKAASSGTAIASVFSNLMDAPIEMGSAPVMGDSIMPMSQPMATHKVGSTTPKFTPAANGFDADAIFAAADEGFGDGSAERAARKRRGGEAVGGELLGGRPSTTPSKVVPKWTPSKLSRGDNSESVRSARKHVQFKVDGPVFDDAAGGDGGEGGEGGEFPLFALPSEKENPASAASANSAPGSAAAGSAGKKAAGSLTEHLRAGKTEPPRLMGGGGGGGLLGGAARVVVSGKPKRNATQRNTVGGTTGSGIAKAAGKGNGLRRMSVATQQAVESAATQKPRRPAWE